MKILDNNNHIYLKVWQNLSFLHFRSFENPYKTMQSYSRRATDIIFYSKKLQIPTTVKSRQDL